MLDRLRIEVAEALHALAESGLVHGTSGNVSGRQDDLIAIKPSGVSYEKITPDSLVVVDLAGHTVHGTLSPSVDTAAHLHIYRNAPEVRGIVHTHSTFATVFAALGRPIPAVLTELADLFGGPIPISAYVPPGDEAIGREFAMRTASGRYRALLMRSHGVFTAGRSPADALKAAIVVEHAAQIVYLAERAGTLCGIDSNEVKHLHEKYLRGYGQSSDGKVTE